MYSDTHAKAAVPLADNKTLVAYDSTATAYYAVSISDGIKNGTVSAGKTLAAEGENVTLTVEPGAGCFVKSVSVNGETITPTGGVYSFTMPNTDVTVNAEFMKSGDVNFDGNVDDKDAALVLKYISAGKAFYPDDEAQNALAKQAANADGKGDVDMLDVIKILEISASQVGEGGSED